MDMDLVRVSVAPGDSLLDVVAKMDRNRFGIALVVDHERRLLGTVTDGDVRRAFLAGIQFEESVETLLARKAGTPFARPISAPASTDQAELRALLKEHSIRHLPLVDERQRVVGLVTSDDFLTNQPLPVRAVVMAGGAGKRLFPLTQDTPKPLLPVGDQPLLEIIIKQLREAGIRQVKLSLHHQPEKISAHFAKGDDLGVELSYVTEDHPLGTIGSLGLLEPAKETTLVMNGDILTQVDFRAMLAYHREHQADLTVAVRAQNVKVPYGIVECDGSSVRGIREKPVLNFFINAGIYLLEPVVYRYIPPGQRLDMTELIERLLVEGHEVISFPIREYWVDIGEREGYAQALADIKTWKQDG